MLEHIKLRPFSYFEKNFNLNSTISYEASKKDFKN